MLVKLCPTVSSLVMKVNVPIILYIYHLFLKFFIAELLFLSFNFLHIHSGMDEQNPSCALKVKKFLLSETYIYKDKKTRGPTTGAIFFLVLTSLKVRYSRKNGFGRFLKFFAHRKKSKKFFTILAVGKFTLKIHVASELYFFHIEPWPENTNRQHHHPPSQLRKKIFSDELYVTQKMPLECPEMYLQGRFWPISVCFKSFHGVLAFGIFTGISTATKEDS